MAAKISMNDILLTCQAKQQSFAKNKTKVLVSSGNDPTVTKAAGYNQYVKTSRTYNTPVKQFFGYDASGNTTKNQSLAQAYGLGVRFI